VLQVTWTYERYETNHHEQAGKAQKDDDAMERDHVEEKGPAGLEHLAEPILKQSQAVNSALPRESKAHTDAAHPSNPEGRA
jgi:hypothetical protein